MAAFAFLLVAAPVDLVRDRVIEQVKTRTGRDLAIAGPAALSLFPRPAISLSDVSLSAPEGSGAPPVLVTSTIEAELSLWSLLTAQPALERMTLHRPTIELSVDSEGRRSWDFTGTRPRRPRTQPATDSAQTEQPAVDAKPATELKRTTALSRLGGGSIRIRDGVVRYRDEGSGSTIGIEALNVTLAADGPDAPLKIDGTLAVRGQPLAIAATVSPAGALLADQPAQLAIKVSGAPFEGTYQGTLALAAGVSLDGTLKLTAPSARAVGDWLGRPLPATADPDALGFSADLKVTPAKVALSRLQANLGAATMSGTLALENTQQRRFLSGSLDVSELDFGRLLTRPRSSARTQAPPAPSPLARSSETPPTPPGPLADKQRRGRDWSDDPIDLALLSQIDAKLTLSAGSLIYKELTTGPGRLSVAAEGGLGRITLEEIELYGGRARGILTLDASGGVPVASSQLILTRVALHPFLTAALQFPWLEGAGKMYLELAGQGLTERQMVESLNGKVEISAAEGAVVGLDVGKIVHSLQRARLPNLEPSPDEKTPFNELAGTFTVTNGVAKNQDMRLVGTHLQLNGEGTLALGPRQIDYTVRTKIGGGSPDPNATIKVGTLEVPIGIVGPWDKPAFGIKGQEQLTGTLKQIRKNLKSEDVRDAIKGLLQGDGEKRVKPRDLIDKLLKKD